ncbi:hypothetical protein AALB53_25110, partial [Lachnospiraceae bacterium 47-T17]
KTSYIGGLFAIPFFLGYPLLICFKLLPPEISLYYGKIIFLAFHALFCKLYRIKNFDTISFVIFVAKIKKSHRQPFSRFINIPFSFCHSSVYYHGNPYIITKTHRQFP